MSQLFFVASISIAGGRPAAGALSSTTWLSSRLAFFGAAGLASGASWLAGSPHAT